MSHPHSTLGAWSVAFAMFLTGPIATAAGLPQIAAGDKFSLMISAEQKVYSWGSDEYGQLGLGASVSSPLPKVIAGFDAGKAPHSRIAAGMSFYVAVRADRSVWTWGNNEWAQLGEGTTQTRSVPVQVPGISDIVAVTAGPSHVLAVKADGSLWAWGRNDTGQLGDGTKTNRLTPVQVSGIDHVVSVAVDPVVGTGYAIKSDGTVWAWGSMSRLTPVQIPEFSGAVAVAAGASYLLVLSSDGLVRGQGDNIYGQLGDGTVRTQRPTPVQTQRLSGVVAIAAGYSYSVAVLSDGTVWVWGKDFSINGGLDPSVDWAVPRKLSGLSGIVDAAVGPNYALAVDANGRVWGWGTHAWGQLGNITRSGVLSVEPPHLNPDLADIKAVAAGQSHVIAVAGDGSVRTWGYDVARVLYRPVPAVVPGLTGVAAATGAFHSLVLAPDGHVWTWGRNISFVLGNYQPDTDGSSVHSLPEMVRDVDGVTAISAAFFNSMAFRSDGKVLVWGNNNTAQLGLSALTTGYGGPVAVSGLPANLVSAVIGGGFQGYLSNIGGFGNRNVSSTHAVALRSDGTVWGWGNAGFGQLGEIPATADQTHPTPQQIPGLSDITKVALGDALTVALRADGTVWTFGTNLYGQLGDGTTRTFSHTPAPVPGLSGVIDIAAHGFHVLALKSDGTVWGWGRNTSGQLGDGTTVIRSTPVQVQRPTDVARIAVGLDHSLAVKSDGSVWAWGANDVGQLGDATTTNRPLPVPIFAASGALAATNVLEAWNVLLDHYFITSDANEMAALDNGSAGPGWKRTGESFRAGGPIAVCRFYGSLSPGPNSHFYSLDGSECQGLRDAQLSASDPRRATVKSWNFERFDFMSARPTNGQCPAGTEPVFRAYNNGSARGIDSNHRITTSQSAIAEVVARGWIAEGVVMCAPS